MAMISAEMNKRLNEQVTNEMAASQHYLAMSCCFERMGLKVFARRFRQQSDEERGHALKIVDYLHEVDGEVTVEAVGRPSPDGSSVRTLVQGALESELKVTRQINDLVALAEQQNDYATRSFLQWFVDEQVEEVSCMRALLQLLSLAGEQHVFQVEARLAAEMKE